MNKLLVVLLILLTGCATQTFNIQSGKSYASKEEMQLFFLDGLGQSKDIDASTVCGGIDKVAKVEVEQSFVEGVISLFTYHIVSPRDARVYCIK